MPLDPLIRSGVPETIYREFVGFDTDGNVRAVQGVQGGVPGGGCVVQTSSRCSPPGDLPAAE